MLIPKIWIAFALFTLILAGLFCCEVWRNLRELSEAGGRPRQGNLPKGAAGTR